MLLWLLMLLCCHSPFLKGNFFLPIGHRTLFIGVHVPLGGRKSHRRHRHRGHKHRKRDRERDSGLEDGRESPPFGKINFIFAFNNLLMINMSMIMHTLSCYGWDMISSGVLENPLEPLQSPLESQDLFLWWRAAASGSQYTRNLSNFYHCRRLTLSVLIKVACCHHWEGGSALRHQLPSVKALEYLPLKCDMGELWFFTISFVIMLMLLELQCQSRDF